jgi:hypothetical protein
LAFSSISAFAVLFEIASTDVNRYVWRETTSVRIAFILLAIFPNFTQGSVSTFWKGTLEDFFRDIFELSGEVEVRTNRIKRSMYRAIFDVFCFWLSKGIDEAISQQPKNEMNAHVWESNVE